MTHIRRETILGSQSFWSLRYGLFPFPLKGLKCSLVMTQTAMLMFLMNLTVVRGSSVNPHSLSYKSALDGHRRILSDAWVGRFLHDGVKALSSTVPLYIIIIIITRTHTHTHTHFYTHTHTQKHTHARTHTHTRARARAHTHTPHNTHTRTHVHACTRTHA